MTITYLPGDPRGDPAARGSIDADGKGAGERVRGPHKFEGHFTGGVYAYPLHTDCTQEPK